MAAMAGVTREERVVLVDLAAADTLEETTNPNQSARWKDKR